MQKNLDNIINFKKQSLFLNARVVDIDTGEVKDCAFIVKNGRISKILDTVDEDFENKFQGQVFDLCYDYVLPAFLNSFCDSLKAFEKTYGLQIKSKEELAKSEGFEFEADEDPEVKTILSGMISMKSALSGMALMDDMVSGILFDDIKIACLEHIENYSEKELEALSVKFHKNKTKLYLKVGLDLNELGTIDKLYHKPLSQVLEDFGFLENRPVIVGGNCFEKDELELLKQHDCTFITTPYEDAREGRRPLNLKTLINLGFDISIGSGYAAEIDMFAYMRQILMNMRGMFEDKNVLSEQEVLKMAITSGKPHKIAVGQEANFLALKNETSFYDDIFKTIVWEKSKRDVELLTINGENLVKNGQIFSNENEMNFEIYKDIIKRITRRMENDD